MTSRRQRSRIANLPLFAFSLAPLLAAGLAQAAPVLPTGGKVVAGSASIGGPGGGAMTITQSSSKAIIDWAGFSIGQGGKVAFQNGSGATLNRVTGKDLSSIDGLLTGTGSVYVINPNGVIIGKTGVVNVGGTFVASTLDVSNANFLTGGALSFGGASTASVLNLGKVGALGGDVALIAATVENDGALSAPNGTVGLAAGTSVVLRDAALDDGKFAVLVGGAGTSATNAGLIQAANAELKAEGGNVYALSGNTAGVIRATGVKGGDGHIWLVADHGTLDVAGVLDAQGKGGSAGAIETSGATVKLGKASIDAHGGRWLLDPTDLTIDADGAQTIDDALNSGTDVTESTNPDGATSSITDSGDGQTAPGPGDINVEAPISWGTTSTLTLSAYHGVNVDAPITATGGGGLILVTDNSGAGNGGTLHFGAAGNVQFNDGAGNIPSGSNLTINGQVYTLVNSLPALSSAIDADNAGFYALATSVAGSRGYPFPASPLLTTISTPFAGVFEGLGNAVNGLAIDDENYSPTGLFGQIGPSGVVRDLNLVGGLVSTIGGPSDGVVGALAGVNFGQVVNVSQQGVTVAGSNWAGGLVGENDGVITGSSATGDVSATMIAGGLVGYNGRQASASIATSYATGAVTVGHYGFAGGLAGVNDGYGGTASIGQSYATGAVSDGGTGALALGGLAGYNTGDGGTASINLSYATGAVTGGVSAVGGLVGYNGDDDGYNLNTGAVGTARITQAFSTGAVRPEQGVIAGGLVGFNDGLIDETYATGSVTGGGGAIIGGLAGVSQGGTLSNSYATGEVIAGSGDNAGGLVGLGYDVTNSYFDTQTTGMSSDGGGGIGVPTEFLQNGRGAPDAAFSAPQGFYPYLNAFYASAPQAISGTAYQAGGYAPLSAAGGAGRNTITVLSGGMTFGQASTGANGYYYVQALPTLTSSGFGAPAPLQGATLAYSSAGGALTGARLDVAFDTTRGFDIWSGALIAPTSATHLAGAQSNGSGLLYGDGGPDGFNADVFASAAGAAAADLANQVSTLPTAGYIASTPTFTVDQAAPATGLYVRNVAGDIVVNPGSAQTVAGGTALDLEAPNGAVVFDASYTIGTPASDQSAAVAGGLRLAAQDLNISFAPGTSVSYVTDANGAPLGAFSLNGQAYTLLNSVGGQDDGSGNGTLTTDSGATDIAGIDNNPGGGDGGNYALVSDVTASGIFSTPLVSPGGGFGGVFEGLGHTISNLNINMNNSDGGEFGLFSRLVGGAVRDVGLVGGSVAAANGDSVGAIAGVNFGQIANVSQTGVLVQGAGRVGGLIGDNEGMVSGSSATGDVSAAHVAGGLIGFNGYNTPTRITDSYATGGVSVGAGGYAGGLVGVNQNYAYYGSYITGSHATGAVSDNGAGATALGGLVGYNTGDGGLALITGSYATGAVSGAAQYAGGLVGANAGRDVLGVASGEPGTAEISGSYATGVVSSSATGAYVGGLVGQNTAGDANSSAPITASYATGAAAGAADALVGGLIGDNGAGAVVTDSYASAAVQGGDGAFAGGLAGQNEGVLQWVYALGSVGATASDSAVGGLVGVNTGAVANAYAVGGVSGGGQYVGGLFGDNASNAILDTFFATDSTGQANGAGATTAAAASQMTGLTRAGMMDATGPIQDLGLSTVGGHDGFVIVDADGTLNGANGAILPLLLAEYSTTISNAHQLQLMALDLTANYTLAGPIDASHTQYNDDVWGHHAFIPVGGNGAANFTGSLSGAVGGTAITGLTVYTDPTNTYGGLFGVIGQGGAASNLNLDAVSVTGPVYTGGVAGAVFGSLSNVSLYGTVLGVYGGATGGLVGIAAGGSTLSNLQFGEYGVLYGGQVSGTGNTGGVAGMNFGTAATLFTLPGSVVSSTGDNVGGVVGYNAGGLTNVYSAASVSAFQSATVNNVGGAVGANYGSVSGVQVLLTAERSVFNEGGVALQASGQNVGGAVGVNAAGATLTDVSVSALDGAPYVFGGGDNVGGLVGWNQGTMAGVLSSAVNVASISEAGANVGGVVGLNQGAIGAADRAATATSVGSVQGDQAVGGLIGWNDTGASAYLDGSSSYTGSVELSGGAYAGGLVGVNYGLISGGSVQNASVNGQLGSGRDFAGGFVGWNAGGTISNASVQSTDVYGERNGDGNGNAYAGGFAGWNSVGATLQGVTANTAIYTDLGAMSGGLAGVNLGSIVQSASSGSLEGGNIAGGLVGLNEGSISRSSSDVQVGGVTMVGGLVGYNDTAGTIDQSYATGSATDFVATGSNGAFPPGYAADDYVGGLVGVNYGQVSNAYATGTVTGFGVDGGLVGANQSGSTVSQAYATGTVTLVQKQGATNVGGAIFGANSGGGSSVYWFPEQSNLAQASGYQAPGAVQPAAVAAAAAGRPSSYPGFDFTSIWTLDSGGPPTLQQAVTPPDVVPAPSDGSSAGAQ